MMKTLEIVIHFRPPITNDTFLRIRLYIFNFRYCKSSSISLQVMIALKPRYLILIVLRAEFFPANQNVRNECFHCAFQVFEFVASGVHEL